MHKVTVSALAIFLAGAWAVIPVGAQDTMKDKAERTGEKIENKAERAGEKIENKAERAGDKLENKADRAEDKTDSAMDKMKAKTREAKDKVKAKTAETKDKLEAKTERAQDKLEAKTDRMNAKGDVRAMQQALKARGHDPGPIDGVHGPRTSAALKSFQQAEGLTVSGHADTETMARLNVPSASPATEPSTSTAPAPGAPPVEKRQSR